MRPWWSLGSHVHVWVYRTLSENLITTVGFELFLFMKYDSVPKTFLRNTRNFFNKYKRLEPGCPCAPTSAVTPALIVRVP